MKKRLLKWLGDVGKDFPSLWHKVETLWLVNKEGFFFEGGERWPEWCFVPSVEIASTLVKDRPELDVSDSLATFTALASALAAWRYSQSIYTFHPALKKELLETPPKGDIPVDVLLQQPEWSVFIECDGVCFSGKPILGFFAELQIDVLATKSISDFEPVLNVLVLFKDESIQLIPIPLRKGVSFDEACACVPNYTNMVQGGFINSTDLHSLLSLLLYVCSDGVEYKGEERPFLPRGKQTRRDGLRLFPAAKVRTWRLGHKIGAQLERDKSNFALWGGKVRPHIRRAHWHTFLAGKRDGEREIRVKWLPPTPVAMPPDDE